MSLYDYLTLIADKTKFTDQLKGNFSITFGDTLMAFIGAGRQLHIVGDEIKYVVDWQGFLKKILSGETGTLAPLWDVLAGAGGGCTFTFGRQTGLNYIGPEIVVRRAGRVAVTSQDLFFKSEDPVKQQGESNPVQQTDSVQAEGAIIEEGVGEEGSSQGANRAGEGGEAEGSEEDQAVEWKAKTKIDKATGVAVALLSSVMVAANTGLEIWAKTAYQQKASENDASAVEMMASLRTSDLMITSRMMAIILAIEKIAAVARNKVTELYQKKDQVENDAKQFTNADLKSVRRMLRKTVQAEYKLVALVISIVLLLAAIAALIVELIVESTPLRHEIEKHS